MKTSFHVSHCAASITATLYQIKLKNQTAGAGILLRRPCLFLGDYRLHHVAGLPLKITIGLKITNEVRRPHRRDLSARVD